MPNNTPPSDVSSNNSPAQCSIPVVKFLIGFTAGICAATFPRLVASLAVGGGESGLVILNAGYLLVSLAFACLVGFVVMIMEWHVAREPKATFMMAIGLPALITGSLNTTTGVSIANEQAIENQALIQEFGEISDIQSFPSGSISPLSYSGQQNIDVVESDQSPAWLDLVGIQSAYAAPAEKQIAQLDFNPNIKIKDPRYYIVLNEFKSKNDAIHKAETLKSVSKTIKAVKSGSRYLVIYNDRPTTRKRALLISVKLKKTLNLKPRLMRE